jgi:CheY-like chemotaxis protein
MALVLVLTRDLLFGSQVQGALTLAGNEVELVADALRLIERFQASADGAAAARTSESRTSDAPVMVTPAVLVADLTDGELDRADIVSSLRKDGRLGATRTLAFYSHVDLAARESAERAGFDLIVARSRMAREGPALVAGLLA